MAPADGGQHDDPAGEGVAGLGTWVAVMTMLLQIHSINTMVYSTIVITGSSIVILWNTIVNPLILWYTIVTRM